MKSFKEFAGDTVEQIVEGSNKGKIKGTDITYETKDGGTIKGPFGDEQSYVTLFKIDGDAVAEVTAADQGIIDCVVKDELALGGLLNSLFEI